MSEVELEFSVSEFVAVFNQTIEYAYNPVVIKGELANFRITKNCWVYFDLKDEAAKIEFFGSVYALPGPLEDGMLVKVRGVPRLHPLYGFSVVYSAISPLGTGSIKRLEALLKAKLEREGLFALERKRSLPYPPQRIGLITSLKSAAYADFTKILSNRWSGLEIDCYDVSVQGEQAPFELIAAIEYFSKLSTPPDVVVMVRGGGSPEDLAAFNHEQLTRAVAASRVPTLVAIGHETDVSLAELAADRRASTPSNAAEVLVPDKKYVLRQLEQIPGQLYALLEAKLEPLEHLVSAAKQNLAYLMAQKLKRELTCINDARQLLNALSPKDVLRRGYAIVRSQNQVTDGRDLKVSSKVAIELSKIKFEADVTKVQNRGY